MKQTIIRLEDDNPIDQKRANAIKYWCNACGELGKNVTENTLPMPLRRAYKELWEESAAGCNCYIVETKDVGYGIALVAEYDQYFANECGLTMDEMFDQLLLDLASLSACEELWCAHAYVLGCGGDFDCHELAIVVPANIPSADWEFIKDAVEVTVYNHPKSIRTQKIIKEKLRKYHESIGDYDIEIGELKFVDKDYVEVPIKYKWKLNANEHFVDTKETIVCGFDGKWTLASGFGFERFEA